MKYLFIFFTSLCFGQFNPIFFAGSPKVEVNTYIGGVSSVITSHTQLAIRLGISSTRVRKFSIIGSDIQCAIIGGGYSLPDNALIGLENYITYYHDPKGLVQYLYGSFWNVTNMTELVFPGLKATLGEIDRYSSITYYDFPNCTSIDIKTWASSNNGKVATVNIPKCLNLGDNMTDTEVFNRWWGNTVWHITVHNSQETINAGAPNPNLLGLNTGSTITYVP